MYIGTDAVQSVAGSIPVWFSWANS